MPTFPHIPRRDWLQSAAAIAALGSSLPTFAADDAKRPPANKPVPKKVAGIVTAYAKGLHADVLLGKILEGWHQDGGAGPALTLASLYVDQFGEKDMARAMAKKHRVPIFKSIAEAISVGTDHVAVDGVISIGEHGDYPWNEKEQHLYPRRRFFQEITDAFQKFGRVVPVFNDKHLGPQWEDAKWMYDRARELKVPFMAGSSLVNTFRQPELDLPLGSKIEAAVGIGYSGLDIYGAHALEIYQSLVERRREREVGVKWVQCLQGEAMRKAVGDGTIRPELLAAAFKALSLNEKQRELLAKKDSALFLFQYNDDFLGSILMLPNDAGGNAIALQLKGEQQPRATRFEERTEPYYPHFAYLLKAIERMVHTGRPTYPVERTLLTSGILDRVLTSRFQKSAKLETPELAIRYVPVDYFHAPKPDLETRPEK